MIKCTIFIPTHYNDGVPVLQEKLGHYIQDIIAVCNGSTVDGLIDGFYYLDGKFVRDRCLRVWAVFTFESQLELLRKIAARIAHDLEQETVYFEWHETAVEFIKPEPIKV